MLYCMSGVDDDDGGDDGHAGRLWASFFTETRQPHWAPRQLRFVRSWSQFFPENV